MNAIRPVRNIGIFAHIDAGKTSLTERLLYVAGSLRAPGDVDKGTTATDFLAVERERGITVKAAAAYLGWERQGQSFSVNLIDTPGHVDFGAEVERSLRALDGAILLLCAVAGVQSRTETLFRACAKRGAPRIAFVNKMDRRGASFRRAVDDLRRILDPGAVVVQIPWGEGEDFRGVIDLVDLVAYDFSDVSDAVDRAHLSPVPLALPADYEVEARAARADLVEAIAAGEGSDSDTASLMEDFVAGREPDAGKLRVAIRVATLACRATPLLCGTAFQDKAAALLLDAVADYLPSPDEAGCPDGREPGTGEPKCYEPCVSAPFSGLVFKTGSDPHFGRLSWTRIWSGAIALGEKVLDGRSGSLARVQKLFRIQAASLESTGSARAGDIVAIALSGAKSAAVGSDVDPGLGATGSTLCDPGSPIEYESIRFDEPVVSLAIEPKAKADVDLLREAVLSLIGEDPSLRFREDPQTGRVELSGMGELHLEVAAERLAREWGARIRVGKPMVAFRETLQAPATAREVFDRDLGGERARATVALRVAPAPRGAGFSFRTEPPMKPHPVLIAAVKRGVEASLSVGPVAGYPLDDVEVVLLELASGKSGEGVDRPSERAVEIAASLALGKAVRAASPELLEPIMQLEIEVSENFLGAAAAAVSRRGGRVESVEATGNGRLVVGAAPLRRLFGFAGELRSSSEGRASYVARFLRHEPVPKDFCDFGQASRDARIDTSGT